MGKELEKTWGEVTIEQRLYSASKSMIWGARITGYFPLYIDKDFKVQFKAWSFPFIWTAFMLFLTILVEIQLYRGYEDFAPITSQNDGPTMRFACSLLGILYACAAFFFKIHAILKRRESAGFWAENYKYLNAFLKLQLKSNFLSDGGKGLARIRRGVQRKMAWGFAFLLFFCLFSSVSFVILTEVFLKNQKVDSRSTLRFLSFIFIGMGHLLVSWTSFVVAVYIHFFLELYKTCYEDIAMELDFLSAESFARISRKGNSAQPQYSQEVLVQVEESLKGLTLLEELLVTFNNHFGIPIVALFLFNTLVTALMVFVGLFFSIGSQLSSSLWNSLPVSFFTSQLYCLATAASNIDAKVRSIVLKLSLLEGERLPPALVGKVRMAVLKNSAAPPSIQPGHYFVLNRKLLTSIFSTLATYIVILTQFYSNDAKKSDESAGALDINGTLRNSTVLEELCQGYTINASNILAF